MKLIVVAILTFLSFINVKAQSNSEIIANKIALKMKDTLQLTDNQKQQIYQINIQLAKQKLALRSQYNQVDSLRMKTQTIENSRDYQYAEVLSSDQFNIYRQKKTNLVNNN
jgi:hypothetical protein